MTIRAARIEDAAALVPLFEDWNHALPEAAIVERLAEWERTPLGMLAATTRYRALLPSRRHRSLVETRE